MRASISQIKLFKACRQAWAFRYREKLIPVHEADALEIGHKYHEYLADLEAGAAIDVEYTKACAMAKAFEKHILPQIDVRDAELEIEKKIGEHTLHGIVDGIATDGTIVEHKTTSRDVSEGGEYEYNLLWDEQVLAYMSLTGQRKVYYTVCKKPTIRQKKDESDEEFYNRMVAWYDEDTAQKIRLFVVERTDDEVEQFEQDFVAICDEMENSGNLYRNTCHCTQYGRRCEYASICLHYDPAQDYIEYIKKEDER